IMLTMYRCVFLWFMCSGEDKRIRDFYQSRGLERVVQPAGDSKMTSSGLPYTSFDHSKAHFYRYDEQVSLCLESSSLAGKDRTKLALRVRFSTQFL
uniref:Uncharacterized protein n=1 Tax=Oryzias sinensis TaxID=183150 RepID=A0A8C7WSF6_9TELE